MKHLGTLAIRRTVGFKKPGSTSTASLLTHLTLEKEGDFLP
jgi:hypothetical protein